MMKSIILVAALSSTSVLAQSNPLASLPTCAQGCVANFTTGAQIGNCAALDIGCICGSQTFISGISCCLYANCGPEDQQMSINYAHQICNTAGVNVPSQVVCPNPYSTYGVPAATPVTNGTAATPSQTGTPAANASTGTASTSESNSSTNSTGTKSGAVEGAVSSGIMQLGLITAAVAGFLAFL